MQSNGSPLTLISLILPWKDFQTANAIQKFVARISFHHKIFSSDRFFQLDIWNGSANETQARVGAQTHAVNSGQSEVTREVSTSCEFFPLQTFHLLLLLKVHYAQVLLAFEALQSPLPQKFNWQTFFGRLCHP